MLMEMGGGGHEAGNCHAPFHPKPKFLDEILLMYIEIV